MTPSALERARALLDGADGVVVLTGAGISAESGVPTFRGEAGLWRSYRPEELATPQAFRADPLLVWSWYAWRRDLVAACRPNAGHEALARWCLARGDVRLVSQNVDGLHARAARAAAGTADPSPALPLDLHGSLFGDRCWECGHRSDGLGRPVDTTSRDTLPRCDRCGGLLRPDVVWFGEGLDPEVLGAAFDAAARADVCLVVGTSAVVHPAASVPLGTLDTGGALVEINPDPTPLSSRCAVALRGPAGTLLPALLD